MKPVLLSLLLLPLASCTTTKPATTATTAATETHAKRGRHHHGKTADKAEANKTATTTAVKPYPLKTCLVTGDKLDPDDEIVTTTYKGQEIKLCCRKCLASFKKNPEKYMAKLNAAG